MKRKKIIIILGIIFLVAIVSTTEYFNIAPYYRKAYSGTVWRGNPKSKEEELLLNFVDERLTDEDGGVRTNYIDVESEGDITKGHSILSESQGLMLLYSLHDNDKERFDKTLNYIKEKMILKSDLLSWRVKGAERSDTSATIDDLRVVKALLLADEKYNDISYRKLAVKIARGIHKNLLDKNIITDFNDGFNKSDTTTLCYLDLPTLKMLANIDYYSWKKTYNESINIVNGGYIGSRIPLYRKNYHRKEEIYDNEDADTLLSMIVILNKLEVNEDVSESIEWIRKQFQDTGVIVTSYSSESGDPASNVESTSIYSMIAQIADKIGDKEIESFAVNKLKGFQVKNENSDIYGGYGSEDGLNVYSYDNLNALLAYRALDN